jgi:hypothetical protein
MKRSVFPKLTVAAVSLVALTLSSPASFAATISLVGDMVYSASGVNGSNAGGGYRYSSNTSITDDYVQLLTPTSPTGTAQGQGISFGLSYGLNTFSFTPDLGLQGTTPVDPGSFAAIELFFNTSGTSYNPSTGPNPGDLVVYASTDTHGSYSVPAAGTEVQGYQPILSDAPYSGADQVKIGNYFVTVTAFSIDHGPDGTFTLDVTAPEPSSIVALGGIGAIGLLVGARRRLGFRTHSPVRARMQAV